MSSTFTFSPPCVPAIPSVIMFKQNGQAVASVRAPVAMASCDAKRKLAVTVPPQTTSDRRPHRNRRFFFRSEAFRDTARR